MYSCPVEFFVCLLSPLSWKVVAKAFVRHLSDSIASSQGLKQSVAALQSWSQKQDSKQNYAEDKALNFSN